MSELTFVYLRDGLVEFSMEEITVDGIQSNSSHKLHGGYFFNFRYDLSDEELESTDEYLDDTEVAVYWNGMYTIYDDVSYKYGEIDEELYLRTGYIVAVNAPSIEEYRALIPPG